jgi:hypothetical protein
VFLEAGLIDMDEIITRAVFFGGGGIGARLAQVGHFLREIEFLAAFSLALRVRRNSLAPLLDERGVGRGGEFWVECHVMPRFGGRLGGCFS